MTPLTPIPVPAGLIVGIFVVALFILIARLLHVRPKLYLVIDLGLIEVRTHLMNRNAMQVVQIVGMHVRVHKWRCEFDLYETAETYEMRKQRRKETITIRRTVAGEEADPETLGKSIERIAHEAITRG